MRQRLALIAVERRRPLRPAVCAVACAAPPVPPRLPSDGPRVPGPTPRNFFSQGLGQSRTADAYTPARFDRREGGGSSSCAGRPQVLPAAGDDAQGGFTLPRRRASRDAGLRRCDTAGAKSLRHRRTVLRARQTPPRSWSWSNQPASNTARARSASPRSRELARRPARCSSLAATVDFPAMPYTLRILAQAANRKKPIRWLANGIA